MNLAQRKNKNLPEQHFVQETREVEVDGVKIESRSTQFVAKGQVLFSLPEMKSAANESSGNTVGKGVVQDRLIAGENVELSEDGRFLLAKIAGFPFSETSTGGKNNTVSCLVVPLIEVSSDGLQVLLQLYPSIAGEAELTVVDLLEELNKQKIIFGIDKKLLEEEIIELHEKRQLRRDIVACRGLLPINGVDAYVRFEMEIGPIAGKKMGNGSIDFRERRMFIGVAEGELIATKILATAGSPGRNIFGEDICAKEGKDITVKVSDDASYLEEKREVRAAKSGILTVVNDNTIKVSEKLMISGDVDFSTGNIQSHNCVEISGSVLSDFIVKTRGDVRIGGNVQAAVVRSRGNIVVTGGVTGENSRLRARGDVDVTFVGRAKIIAGGTIVVRKEAYYCRLSAAGDIHCDEKSRIVGGVLACSGDFSGGNIGTQQAEPAVIAAGVGKKQYKRYLKIKKKIREQVKKRDAVKAQFGKNGLKKSRSRKLEAGLDTLRGELSQLDLEKEGSVRAVEIVVYGDIFAGTRLRIGNVQRTLKKDFSKVKCTVDRKLNKIVIESLVAGS